MRSLQGLEHPHGELDPSGASLRPARSDGRGFSCPKDVTGSHFLTCVYEGTGEAVGVFLSRSQGADIVTGEERELERLAQFCTPDGELVEGLVIEDALKRRAENLARSNRRAITECRRFVVANGLTKMWTFTFKEEHWDKAEVKRLMNDFFQRWRKLEGKPFPYLYVLELHPGGHGYHVHVAVPGWMFTDFFQLRRVWGHGRIRFDKRKRETGGPRDASRRLALYLVKYITKGFEDSHEFGEHRYERAEDFPVVVTRRRFSTFKEMKDYLLYFASESFTIVWSDYEVDAWSGPPTWVCRSGAP